MNQGGDGDEVRIPLTIDPDASGLASAQEAAQAFEGTIEDLRREIARLQQEAVSAFNAIQQSVRGGSQGVSSFADLQTMRAGLGGPRYAPVASAMTRAEHLETLAPAVAGADREARRLQAWVDQGNARELQQREASQRRAVVERERIAQQNARDMERRDREAGRTRPAPLSERFTERMLRTRPLTTLGAFSAVAQGDFAGAGRTMARAFIEVVASAPSRRGAASIAAAVQGAGTVAGAAEAGAATEGTAAGGGLAGIVGALSSGPLGAILAGIVASAAVALGVNVLRSQVAGQEYALRANVGGTAGADMGRVTGGVLDTGHRFLYTPQQALALADQLGGAGVGAGQLGGAEAASMAMGRLTGMDPGQIGQITASLIVQGHESAAQVAAVFQTLREGADRSGVSLVRLVSSLQDFQRLTGGAALGVQGAAGLAAVQGMLGPGISAGGLLGPAMGAIGTQAFQVGGVLGISQDELARAQTDPAVMQDLIAREAKQIGVGLTGQARISAVESVLQSTGLMNFQGMSPQNVTRTIGGLLTQSPRAAEDARDAALRASALKTETDRELQILRDGEIGAQAMTSAVQKAALNVQYFGETVGLVANDINRHFGTSVSTRQAILGGGPQINKLPPPRPANAPYTPSELVQDVETAYPQGLNVPGPGGSTRHITPGQLANAANAAQGDPTRMARLLGVSPSALHLPIAHSQTPLNRVLRRAMGSTAGPDPFPNAPWFGTEGVKSTSDHTVNVTIHVADTSGNRLGTVQVQHTAPRLPIGHRTHGPAPASIPTPAPPPRATPTPPPRHR